MFAEIQKKYLKEPLKIPFIITTAGQSLHEHKNLRPHGLPHHHFLIVTKGAAHFEVGESSFTLSKGQGFFMRKDVPHRYGHRGEDFSTIWVTFLGGDSILDYYGIDQSFTFNAPSLLEQSTQKLIDHCNGNSTILSRSAAGYSWLNEWLGAAFSESAPLEVQVRRFLEVHFAEDLSLEQIAAAVHMSRFTLCHYYRQHCNHSVMDQLKQIRLEKAARMLRFTSASIEEIGKNCGIESPSYFAKLFKEQTNYTPRAYRNKNKG